MNAVYLSLLSRLRAKAQDPEKSMGLYWCKAGLMANAMKENSKKIPYVALK